MSLQSPYQILGEDGIRKLAHSFYDVMDELPQAKRIRKMHAKNRGAIKEKLTEYLVGWMGGPPLYRERKGTVYLTDPHAAYLIGPQERDQWVLCFEKALERMDATEELKAMLKAPIYRIAEAVRNAEHSTPETRDPNHIPTISLNA